MAWKVFPMSEDQDAVQAGGERFKLRLGLYLLSGMDGGFVVAPLDKVNVKAWALESLQGLVALAGRQCLHFSLEVFQQTGKTLFEAGFHLVGDQFGGRMGGLIGWRC